jgi:hypothetical protein
MKRFSGAFVFFPFALMAVAAYFILKDNAVSSVQPTTTAMIAPAMSVQIQTPGMTDSLEIVLQQKAIQEAYPHEIIQPDLVRAARAKAHEALEYGMIQNDELNSYIVANIEIQKDRRMVEAEQQDLSPEYMSH